MTRFDNLFGQSLGEAIRSAEKRVSDAFVILELDREIGLRDALEAYGARNDESDIGYVHTFGIWGYPPKVLVGENRLLGDNQVVDITGNIGRHFREKSPTRTYSNYKVTVVVEEI